MVISHKHKYVFVELPLTGSTAIHRELCTYYDGMPILRHHATYHDFLKRATRDERSYFVFSCIRNPLDHTVSLYFKYKTDHKEKWSDPRKVSKRKGLVSYLDMKRFSFIKDTGADFSTYFNRFYKIPYNNWSWISHRQFDFIIRFERLQEDFANALRLMGIEPIRPLPVVNQTSQRDKNYLVYYTPEVIPRARRVFGPYMKQWGYAFPSAWGDDSVPWWHQLEFDLFNVFRNAYWRYLRFRI
jgi:hypothetical protein